MLPFDIEKNMDAIRAEIEKSGAELVDIAFRRIGNRHVLTITADKQGGITLDECAGINQRLSRYFDEKEREGGETLQGAYDLEVVSPGLDRALKTERDFLRAVGDTVMITIRRDGESNATWRAKVKGSGPDGVQLELKDGAVKTVAFDHVLHAHREIGMNSKRQS